MFDDEFNGTALDTSKWSSSWFGGGVMNNTSTSPANVSVANGILTLTLSSTSVGALVSTNPTGGASEDHFTNRPRPFINLVAAWLAQFFHSWVSGHPYITLRGNPDISFRTRPARHWDASVDVRERRPHWRRDPLGIVVVNDFLVGITSGHGLLDLCHALHGRAVRIIHAITWEWHPLLIRYG